MQVLRLRTRYSIILESTPFFSHLFPLLNYVSFH